MSHYSLYGDESYYQGIATYGIVGFPTHNTDHVNKTIASIKNKHGIRSSAIFHTRNILSYWKRRKTSFSSLKREEDVFQYIVDIILELRKIGVFYRLGYTSKIQPSSITNMYPGKYSIPVKDTEKRLCVFAANAATCGVKAEISTNNITLFTEECPFIIKTGVRKEFVHNLYGADFLKLSIMEKSPGALEIADILAYTASHALIKSSRNHKEFCCLLWLFNPSSWIFQGIDAPLFHSKNRKERVIGRFGASPLNFEIKNCTKEISLIDIKHEGVLAEITLSNAYENDSENQRRRNTRDLLNIKKPTLKTNIVKGGYITFFNIDKTTSHNDTDLLIYYINQGVSEALEDNVENAIGLFSQAIKIDPLNLIAYYNRSIGYMRIKNYVNAINDLCVAISLNPQDYMVYCQRGLAYSYLNKYKEAIDDYDKCINLYPQCDEAYCNRGVSKIRLKNHRGAFEDFNKAIALNLKNVIAYINRGSLKASLGHYNEALLDIEKAISIDPCYASAYYEKGRVLIDLNKYEEATISIEKAKELDSSIADTYYTD